ncbi:MAG: AraC family transcriptional regulator, partial [Acutalibacteraceae bacterium]|nr:AraC family transcriptional regulator [Acutalibacteraceae bacterium]
VKSGLNAGVLSVLVMSGETTEKILVSKSDSSLNALATDAAIECGFNSISYFTKTFKKYKSISPSQYRKNKLG